MGQAGLVEVGGAGVEPCAPQRVLPVGDVCAAGAERQEPVERAECQAWREQLRHVLHRLGEFPDDFSGVDRSTDTGLALASLAPAARR